MDLDVAFGTILKRLRLERGLSQEELADLSGFHRTYVSLLERGLKTPSLTTLQRIAGAFKIPTHQMVLMIEEEAARVRPGTRKAPK
jgi:transcriptional regulator with XRE-family HTH domain